jgi:hypothetical protein
MTKKINQFSPIRTGSTLIYNYLKFLLKDYHIVKQHNINKNEIDIITVITMRHPYNSILSTILVNEVNKENYIIDNSINLKKLDSLITNEILKKTIDHYLKYGGKDLLSINYENLKNKLIFKYEEIINNHCLIIKNIEIFLKKNFNDIDKEKILEFMNIDNVKKNYSDKYKEFKNYDKNTHLHGQHISEFLGNTDYKNILSNEKIKILLENNELNQIINKFNYN